jgi:hypothetical protein
MLINPLKFRDSIGRAIKPECSRNHFNKYASAPMSGWQNSTLQLLKKMTKNNIILIIYNQKCIKQNMPCYVDVMIVCGNNDYANVHHTHIWWDPS